MGLLDRLNLTGSSRSRLLAKLAEITGRREMLAGRVARHSAMCSAPRLKEELAAIAAKEREQVNLLRRILSDAGIWPREAEAPAHDGSSNWERVSNDVEMLLRITIDLNKHLLDWNGEDPAIAAQLDAILEGDGLVMRRLREVAAKSDPQALN